MQPVSCRVFLIIFCVSWGLTEAVACGQTPAGGASGFTKTLLKQQNLARTSPVPAPAATEVPQPIPTRAVLPWKPEQQERHWKFVVVHHSATLQGDVAGIHREHSQRVDASGKPWRGIAYHFVIGNGRGMTDGEVQATFRWEEQLEGAHAGDQHYNQAGIGICLIGDFEQHRPTAAQLRSVQELIGFLRREYQIPAENVVGHSHVKSTNCPGKYFPLKQVANQETGVPRTAAARRRAVLQDEDAPNPEATRIR